MERLKNVMLLKRMMTVVMIMMIVVLSGAGCAVKKSESDEKNETNQQAITDTAKEDAPQENESSKMTKEDTMEYRVAVLKGPTGIGFVKAWDDSENSKTLNTYNCTAYGTADEITAGIIKGDIDLAAVPCNLASVLYQKTGGKIKIAAINTLGVLYILSTSDEIKSVEDLKGKTIYTTGQGTTPEYTLNYILKQNHLTPGEDVTIEYKSEAAEVAALMSESDDVIAMLPQPYVTTVLQKNENMKIVLDMTKEWNQVSDETLVTGVVIARDEVIEKNEKAFEQFGISAFQHNKNGLRMMGVCYCLGLGTECSLENAVKAYKRAADNGSTAALYDLAAMYEYGHGFERNYKKAFKLYSIAAENNCLRALVKVGEFYFFGKSVYKDQKKAVDHYRKAADKSDPAAMYNLGMCYYSGNGVEKDYYTAFDLFMKSANRNYVPAYNGVGICYVTGNGVAKSEHTAAYWYDKGARLGNAAAQYNLGLSYYWGNGVEQNKPAAAQLFEKSAKQGHAAAQFRLGECFYFGSGIEKDLSSAVYWYETAAKNNNANAQFRLGNCHCQGKGVAKNMQKAVYWYEKAAAQGNQEAKKMLDEIR